MTSISLRHHDILLNAIWGKNHNLAHHNIAYRLL